MGDVSEDLKLLCLVPTSLQSLREKGNEGMILERDLDGFFSHVYTVHLFSDRSRTVELADGHTVIEYPLLARLERSPIRSLWTIYFEVRFLVEMVLLVYREDIDVVRVQDPHYDGLNGLVIATLTPARFCISLHTDYAETASLRGSEESRLRIWLRGFVLRRAEMVLPISDYIGDVARSLGVPDNRIHVIPHGVDIALFSDDSTDVLDLGPGPSIVYVGRLSREKYVYDLVRIAELVSEKWPDTTFYLVGDGPEREGIEATIADGGLEGCVKLLGFRPRAEAIGLLRAADVSLCLLCGFSLIEAGLAGNPIVTYDVEWHSEFIESGETGFLVPEGDIEGAAEKIEELLRDDEFRERMGARARRRARTRHTIEASNNVKRRWFRELLGVDATSTR